MSQPQTSAVNPNHRRAPLPNPNPPPPSMAPLPPKPPIVSDYSTTTLKRPRDGEPPPEESPEVGAWADEPAAKRRVKAGNDVIYRIVVPSKQIGKVIGRSGHRIQKIREDTKATIKIADAISRYEERVIIISSKDSDSSFSDAENALHQIVSLILKDDGGNVEELKVGVEHVAANTVRLLIASNQAGGLIGVSGQNIVNLRSTSGATITVLSPNQLPPCASAHESDRVVQISGEIPEVLRAVVEIGCQLRDNTPKQVISVNPTNNIGFNRQPQQYVDPTSADYITMELMVPENLVGGLIGRFGANISRIRNESGANIKVHGARGEQTQRQIHLAGSAQQVTLAKQRVDEYVYAELMRQSGGSLPQSSGQLQQYSGQQSIPDVSNTLYQGYGHVPGLYATSTQDAGMMGTIPQMYVPPAINQPHPYYGHQSYHAPPPL